MTSDESYKPSPATPPGHAGLRHPAAAAWDQFRSTQGQLFAGTPHGWALESRLNAAFEQGWNAAARAILDALGRMGDRRDSLARWPIDQLEIPTDLNFDPDDAS
jgi:hypothetical protein